MKQKLGRDREPTEDVVIALEEELEVLPTSVRLAYGSFASATVSRRALHGEFHLN